MNRYHLLLPVLAVLWTLLGAPNMTLELYRLTLPEGTPLAHNRYFLALLPLHDALKSGVLFRAGFWLALSLASLAWALPARGTASGTFAICIAGAGILYVLTFGLLGVAADFRYAHWGVVASLAGLVPALVARAEMRAQAQAEGLLKPA